EKDDGILNLLTTKSRQRLDVLRHDTQQPAVRTIQKLRIFIRERSDLFAYGRFCVFFQIRHRSRSEDFEGHTNGGFRGNEWLPRIRAINPAHLIRWTVRAQIRSK